MNQKQYEELLNKLQELKTEIDEMKLKLEEEQKEGDTRINQYAYNWNYYWY